VTSRPPFIALLSALAVASAAQGATRALDAHVIAVADGDSITVRDSNQLEHDVRLAGIDAPEHGQPYSRQAKLSLARSVLDRDVRIEWGKRDDYRRFVAKVWVGPADAPCAVQPCPKTLDVGLAQVTSGLAWHYKRYAPEQSEEDRHRYADAEVEARARKSGLWQDPQAVPPWEWRHGLEHGPIKKSRSDICHPPDSAAYRSVRHFRSYPTVEACIASGGRAAKASGR
jgi:endonuclease YncB( thermonuclease family)